MHTWAQVLFYFTFLGQIFLVSWYFPRRQIARVRHILKTYPPAEYPKLYPTPKEDHLAKLWLYQWANRIIVALGLLLILALVFLVDHSTFADDGYISEAWPLFFALIQFLPVFGLEFSACGQHRLMRRLNSVTVRRAQLVPRRISDFLSPTTLIAAAALAIAAVVFDAVLNGVTDGNYWEILQRSAGLIFGNGFMAVFGFWLLHSRKPNPHQSAHSRAREISANFTSMVCVSIALSIFYMAGSLDRAFDLDHLDATISSIYVLVIASLSIGYLMQTLTLRPTDFEAYKS